MAKTMLPGRRRLLCLGLYIASSALFLVKVIPPALRVPLIAQLCLVTVLSAASTAVAVHAALVLALNTACISLSLPIDKAYSVGSSISGSGIPNVWWALPSCLMVTMYFNSALQRKCGLLASATRVEIEMAVVRVDCDRDGDGDGEEVLDYERDEAASPACRRLPAVVTVWVGHCLYLLTAVFAVDSPDNSMLASILYVSALCALFRYDSLRLALWKQQMGAVVVVGCGLALSWLAFASALQPVVNVAMGADVSSKWCDVYVVAHAAVHALFVFTCGVLATLVVGVVCAYMLTKRIGWCLALAPGLPGATADERPRPNVLFILNDDMRAEIAGPPYSRGGGSVTPNVDRLLSKSTVFTHAYSQGVYCVPSRASFMTGLRQTDSSFWMSGKEMATLGAPTIPMIFKDAGYRTLGAGKTFHSADDPKNWDQDRSWTEPYIPFENEAEKKDLKPLCLGRDQSHYYCPVPVRSTDLLVDRKTVDRFTPVFRELIADSSRQPFFAMIGLYKPHKPWMCPASSYDAIDVSSDTFEPQEYKGNMIAYYNHFVGMSPLVAAFLRTRMWWKCNIIGRCGVEIEDVTIDEDRWMTAPDDRRLSAAAAKFSARPMDTLGMDRASVYKRSGLASRLHHLVFGDEYIITESVSTVYNKHQPMSREAALMMRKAYRSCIHWTDHLIGEVLTTLEANEAVARNTIVVFSSDHGFSLGENNLWQKYTLFEASTHVPLSIRLPPSFNIGSLIQRNVASPTELVDLLPTLAALARIELPVSTFRRFSGTALLNANGSLVEFEDERIAYSMLLRCIEISPDCASAEGTRQTSQVRLIVASVGLILTGLMAGFRQKAMAERDDSRRSLSRIQQAALEQVSPSHCAFWVRHIRSLSRIDVAHLLALAIFVVAALVAIAESALLPPPHLCEWYDGRWINPEYTKCDNVKKKADNDQKKAAIAVCAADYLGVAARSASERYVAWFNASQFYRVAEPLPILEEFYVYAGLQPYDEMDRENLIADHRSRADELLVHVQARLDEYSSSFDIDCATHPHGKTKSPTREE